VTSESHSTTKSNTKTYGTVSKPITIKHWNGKTISFNSRVPARDLYDISALILINMLVICPLFKRSRKTISC
jgi:hypothetical protein